MQQDGTLGNMWLVRSLQVNDFLKKIKGCVWYQYDIYLAENRIFGKFQFGTTGRNKIKYPDMIDDKQWKELDNEGRKKGINTSDTKEVVPLRR